MNNNIEGVTYPMGLVPKTAKLAYAMRVRLDNYEEVCAWSGASAKFKQNSRGDIVCSGVLVDITDFVQVLAKLGNWITYNGKDWQVWPHNEIIDKYDLSNFEEPDGGGF